MSTITIEVLAEIKHQYRLSWHGTHGVIHWSRVYENGMKLAEQDGVNRKVLQLFSIFHDSRRRNEHWDKNHGNRGAQLALTLCDYCPLDGNEFSLLTAACALNASSDIDMEVIEILSLEPVIVFLILFDFLRFPALPSFLLPSCVGAPL